MQSNLISNESLCDNKADANFDLYQKGYQQALDDFAVAELVIRLQTHTEANSNTTPIAPEIQDIESLAVLFIQNLTANLNDKLFTSYLEALRHIEPQSIRDLSFLQQPPVTTSLPASFPKVGMPQFSYGDHLRWASESK